MKLFVCVWGSWIVDNTVRDVYDDAIELHDETFFEGTKGYDAENIRQVDKLDIGESYVSEFGNHIVTRIS